MPIYEYECRDCGKISEFLVGVVKDEVEMLCTHCGSRNLDKILSQSFVARSGKLSGPQYGKTCCGRDERCNAPPCEDEGTCVR